MTMPFPILGVDVEITGLSASLTWEVMGVAENIELEIERTYDSKCRSSQSTSTRCYTCTKPSLFLKPVTGCSISRLNIRL
jgi:hypothetical protein